MKKKMIYSIALGMALSVLPTVATEEISELKNQLNVLTERIDQMEKDGISVAEPAPGTLASWANKIQIKGDFRYRYQYVQVDHRTSKSIQRMRVRLGIFGDVNDFTKLGLGIRTGDKANSGNVTLGDGFEGKDISLSLAYAAFSPYDEKYGTAILGKMKQPWKNTTDLIWDSDVNPEGFAYTYSGKMKDTGLIGSAGYYRIEDNKAKHDTTLASGQLGVTQPLGEHLKATVGGSMYYYHNTEYVTFVDYRIAEGFGEIAFKDILPIPFKLYGNYVNNLAEDDSNEGYCVGIKFGNAKKGKWEAKLDFRELDVLAAPGTFTDSDFADGGAGIRGWRIKGKYNLAKNLQFGVAYIDAKRTFAGEPDYDSLFLDLLVKF